MIKYICDRCGKEVDVGNINPRMPEGWQVRNKDTIKPLLVCPNPECNAAFAKMQAETAKKVDDIWTDFAANLKTAK